MDSLLILLGTSIAINIFFARRLMRIRRALGATSLCLGCGLPNAPRQDGTCSGCQREGDAAFARIPV